MEKTYTYNYPHAALTADCVVFGFDGKRLHLLLIERGLDPQKGWWALPGGFFNPITDDSIEACASRELLEETGVKNVYLEQFHVFSAKDRDPRERVVTTAFLALVRKDDYKLIGGDDAINAQWFEVNNLPENIAFDHKKIIDMARETLQLKIRTEPMAFRLLNDDHFIMSELQNIYEAINCVRYDRRNFAKKMLATGLLQEVSNRAERSSNRIPLIYRYEKNAIQPGFVKIANANQFDFRMVGTPIAADDLKAFKVRKMVKTVKTNTISSDEVKMPKVAAVFNKKNKKPSDF